ncbi:hypothetical protein PMAYCL1PPCAC_01564, partial [Pristionchus mayeri]
MNSDEDISLLKRSRGEEKCQEGVEEKEIGSLTESMEESREQKDDSIDVNLEKPIVDFSQPYCANFIEISTGISHALIQSIPAAVVPSKAK